MSSTFGSLTVTGWKRRSRAASFSTYLRYSSSVVAPMQRSSPRARAGLSRLAASLPPSAPAGAHHRVQFVDEEHDVAGAGDFLQDGLEPLLEFAAELGAGHQRAHVQGDDAAILEALGHVAVDDPQGQALDDGRLAHARLADQHGVVLGTPREDLDHAADFLIAADHRVELSLPGPLDQVDAIALQGLELGLGVLVRDPLAAANGLHGLQDFLVRQGVELEDVLGLGVDFGQGQQEVFGGDELVLHGVGLALGGLQHAGQFAAGLRGRAAADLGQPLQLAADDSFQLPAIGADLLQQRRDHALGLVEQGVQADGAARSANGPGRWPATGRWRPPPGL